MEPSMQLTHELLHPLGLAILITTFALAGLPKLRTPMPLATTFVQLGLTNTTRPHIARSLGALELATALTLLMYGNSQYTLVLSTGLLLTFCIVLCTALRNGIKAPCACFGAETRPITILTVTRTVVLLCLSIALLSVPSSESSFTQRVLALALVTIVVGCAAVISQAYRSNPFVSRIVAGER